MLAMETIVDAAVDYSLLYEKPRIAFDDLERAFISGARWMVEDKTDRKKRDKEVEQSNIVFRGAITEMAKLYGSMFEGCNLTKYDLEQAFISGAKWMVGRKIDRKTLEKIKEKQKNSKIVVEFV